MAPKILPITHQKIHPRSLFAKQNPQTFQIQIIKAALKEIDDEKEDNTVKAINRLSEIIIQSMKTNENDAKSRKENKEN